MLPCKPASALPEFSPIYDICSTVDLVLSICPWKWEASQPIRPHRKRTSRGHDEVSANIISKLFVAAWPRSSFVFRKIPTFTLSQTITKVPLTQHPFWISYLLTLVEFTYCCLVIKTYQSESRRGISWESSKKMAASMKSHANHDRCKYLQWFHSYPQHSWSVTRR